MKENKPWESEIDRSPRAKLMGKDHPDFLNEVAATAQGLQPHKNYVRVRRDGIAPNGSRYTPTIMRMVIHTPMAERGLVAHSRTKAKWIYLRAHYHDDIATCPHPSCKARRKNGDA